MLDDSPCVLHGQEHSRVTGRALLNEVAAGCAAVRVGMEGNEGVEGLSLGGGGDVHRAVLCVETAVPR